MSAEDALDESLHVLVMGAGLVQAIAGGADTKIVITLSRSWWQPVMDRLFCVFASAPSSRNSYPEVHSDCLYTSGNLSLGTAISDIAPIYTNASKPLESRIEVWKLPHIS